MIIETYRTHTPPSDSTSPRPSPQGGGSEGSTGDANNCFGSGAVSPVLMCFGSGDTFSVDAVVLAVELTVSPTFLGTVFLFDPPLPGWGVASKGAPVPVATAKFSTRSRRNLAAFKAAITTCAKEDRLGGTMGRWGKQHTFHGLVDFKIIRHVANTLREAN